MFKLETVIQFNKEELFLIRDSIACKMEEMYKIKNWFFDNNVDIDDQKLTSKMEKYHNLFKDIDSILEGKK